MGRSKRNQNYGPLETVWMFKPLNYFYYYNISYQLSFPSPIPDCVKVQMILLTHIMEMSSGKPGKSWNFIMAFSRTGKSWKKATGPGEFRKSVKLK